MVPHERRIGAGVLQVVSMGFLVEDEETALMWRGLMLNRGVQHFLQDVDWGDDLDYLLIDMPPGTGDVQMGVAKLLPRAEVLVVTTPALAAQKVAERAVGMARKSYLRVAGVIENMSAFTCDHGDDLRPVRRGRRRGSWPTTPACPCSADPARARRGRRRRHRAARRARRGPGGRRLPGHRRHASSTRRCRPSRWPAAAPACSTPPSPPSTRSTPPTPRPDPRHGPPGAPSSAGPPSSPGRGRNWRRR